MESAEHHLSRLMEICGGPCPEADDLREAIERYREEGEAAASDGG